MKRPSERSERLGMAALCCVVGAACGPTAGRLPATPAPAAEGFEVTLYRDHTTIAQRMWVTVGGSGATKVRVRVAAGTVPADVYAIDTDLELTTVQPVTPPPNSENPKDPVDRVIALAGDASELELSFTGRAGHYPVTIAYDTLRITWESAYTVLPLANGDVTVRGAIAIRNAIGFSLPPAVLWVVDYEHGSFGHRSVDRRGRELYDRNGKLTTVAAARLLGSVELVDGDTRIELIDERAATRRAHPVVVYDPIGSKLDHAGESPVRERSFGVTPPPRRTLLKGYEIARDPVAMRGLPGGIAHLLAADRDGRLSRVGEGRMFGTALAKATVDTLQYEPAANVTGRRERVEMTLDTDRRRLAEDFRITIENHQPTAVDVVIREHMYRGENWTLAYLSLPLDRASQEGPQQIAIRGRVPGSGTLIVSYTVVYWWEH